MDLNNVSVNALSLNHLAFEHTRAHAASRSLDKKDGHWFAALIANNPKIVRSFSDHEEVATKLLEAREFQQLFDVATSGLLDAVQASHYRQAYKQAHAV